MSKRAAIKHERSSGNVFADVGLPGEYLAKAEVVARIDSIIAERNLTQSKAAMIMGIDQPRVSALLCGKLSLFSLEKLLTMVGRLGNRIEIAIKAAPTQHGVTIVKTRTQTIPANSFSWVATETTGFPLGNLVTIAADQQLIGGTPFPYWAMTEDREQFYSHG